MILSEYNNIFMPQQNIFAEDEPLRYLNHRYDIKYLRKEFVFDKNSAINLYIYK